MLKFLVLISFIIISFFTGMSLMFNVCSILMDEEKFFVSTKNALIIYLIGILGGILFTIFSYNAVCIMQRIF